MLYSAEMSGPLVTVVTPSYNQGQFIRATIESVLSQDYPQVEYIIMDGASNDETASVVKDYASRLTFISEKDRGQSHAINKGFRMARGSILSWLNSDDTILPGSIQKAVAAFGRAPEAGAVYGEGYQMNREGEIVSRFPHTEPPNLWKLVYLSDYILQQTVYFRKAVLDDVGYLDEDLHYTMDWDLLIRIALKYPLEYIPEYLGCLREYPEAKSFSGGLRRAREIREMLRRHTGMRFPPGAVVYGLDTYTNIWCEGVERRVGSISQPLSRKLQSVIRTAMGLVIGRTVYHSQGLYGDGCASRIAHYVLPPGEGPIVIEGHVPGRAARLGLQRIRVDVEGRCLGKFTLRGGDFRVAVEVPQALQGHALRLAFRNRQWMVPARFRIRGDRRRISFRLKGIRRDPELGCSLASETAAGNGSASGPNGPGMAYFASEHYRLHNRARLDHLASLGLPIAGRVIEVGSGPGDHTGFYLERGCTVVATDAREECLRQLQSRFPKVETHCVDMDDPRPLSELGKFDIVHCYGLLYHLRSPESAIAALSSICKHLLLLETCVSPEADARCPHVIESRDDFTQSSSGVGCRPTRTWIFETVKRYFPFVYQTRTQPDHPEFPTDWTDLPADNRLRRIVLVASTRKCESPLLSPELLEHQVRWRG